MGIFDSLFDDGPDMAHEWRLYRDQYKRLQGDVSSMFGSLVSQFGDERTRNLGLYNDAYNSAITDFERRQAQARAGLASGLDAAYATLESGRENTLALMRQATESAIGRATASNAFGGLSNTTFGQRAIDAVASHGALQQGALIEQYAQTLASAQAARAQALASFDQWSSGAMLDAGMGRTRDLSNMSNQYSFGALNAQASGIQQYFNLGTTPYDARYQYATGIAPKPGGPALAGGLLGAGIGAIGNLIGGAFA